MQSYKQYRAFRQAPLTTSDKVNNAPDRSAFASAAASTVTLAQEEAQEPGPHKTEASAVSQAAAVPGGGGSDNADPFLVVFTPGEEHNPQNWSTAKRYGITLLVAHTAMLVGAAASINSGAVDFAAEELGVSVEVMGLDTAVFLIGLGLASPILAPLSELGGRSVVYLGTLLLFVLFEVGCALSPNFGSRLVLRFLAGVVGSTPLGNAGGTFGDIWTSAERTVAFPLFSLFGFIGPVLGPILGGYLGQSKLGYRWCDWISAIWGAFVLVTSFWLLPETFAPTLLAMKAKEMRERTGDPRYKTALERRRETIPFLSDFKEALLRPIMMLIYEPIVLLFSLYMTVVYIILFGSLVAYPFIYKSWDLNAGEIGLTFLPIIIGLLVVVAATPLQLWSHRRASAAAATDVDEKGRTGVVQPEERLKLAMVGTWALPLSLFWLAWTSDPSWSIWVPLASEIFFGVGILSVFIASYQYIMEAYQAATVASALSVLTVIRYPASGAAVMFTSPMLHTLGRHWGITLLAILSALVSLIPYVFYARGARIRSWSRYAPKP